MRSVARPESERKPRMTAEIFWFVVFQIVSLAAGLIVSRFIR